MQQHVLTSSMNEVTRSHHGKSLESNACLGSLSHSIPYHPRPTRRLFVTEPYSCGIELRGPRVIWCARSRTTRDVSHKPRSPQTIIRDRNTTDLDNLAKKQALIVDRDWIDFRHGGHDKPSRQSDGRKANPRRSRSSVSSGYGVSVR